MLKLKRKPTFTLFVLGSMFLLQMSPNIGYSDPIRTNLRNQGTQAGATIWVTHATNKIFQDKTGGKLSTLPGVGTSTNLKIAKNGLDFFQVVLSTGTSPITNVKTTVSDLHGQTGNILSQSNVRIFLEYYVNVRSDTYYESVLDYTFGKYPDALVPLGAPFDIDANANQPLWVEIDIPKTTIPDTYTGTISFSGGIQGSVSLSIEVLDFEVSTHSGLFNPAYADFWVLNQDNSLTDQQYLNEIGKYTEFFTKRDLNLARSIDPVDVPNQDTSGNWQFDSWLSGMAPILNGGILTEFNPPILRVPVDLEVLGFTVDTASSTEAQTAYKNFLTQFKTYITSQSIVTLPQNTKWMIWIGEFDEPNTAEIPQLIDMYYKLTQEVNDVSFSFDYQVDGTIDWAAPAIQHDYTQDISSWTTLSNSFDIWLTPLEDFEFDLPYITDRINTGKQVLLYQQAWTAIAQDDQEIPPGFSNRDYEFPSLPGIVNPALFHRILPWFTWKYHASGVGFWAVMYWYNGINNTPVNVWIDDPALWIMFRTQDHIQNGDGWLIYPGDQVQAMTGQPNVDGPVSSLRLELFRKGLEDYKYLKLLRDNIDNFNLSSKTKATDLIADANQLLNTITSFERDPSLYDSLLSKIKDLLAGQSISNNNSSEQTGEVSPWLFDIPTVLFVVTILIVLKKRQIK